MVIAHVLKEGDTSVITYFSSVSGYTQRFVEKVALPAQQIPIRPRVEGMLEIAEPCVLIVPTYGAGPHSKAIPKQVIQFLNIESNRNLVWGVIGAGNTNFGEAYAIAGDIISHKLQVPLLYRFEIVGTPEDVVSVREGIPRFLSQRSAELGYGDLGFDAQAATEEAALQALKAS